jgi:hypothetical protein
MVFFQAVNSGISFTFFWPALNWQWQLLYQGRCLKDSSFQKRQQVHKGIIISF